MPKVQVFKSKYSDKYFPLNQRNTYLKHLGEIRKDLQEARKNKKMALDWENFIKTSRQNVSTLEELARWIIDNSSTLASHARSLHHFGFYENTADKKRNRKFDEVSITRVEIQQPYYTSLASNSHSSPAGTETNWIRDTNLPMGYPGIKFQLLFSVKETGRAYGGSGIFEGTCIHTGTGGGSGGGKYGFSVTVFLADWPNLMGQDLVFSRLMHPFDPSAEQHTIKLHDVVAEATPPVKISRKTGKK